MARIIKPNGKLDGWRGAHDNWPRQVFVYVYRATDFPNENLSIHSALEPRFLLKTD